MASAEPDTPAAFDAAQMLGYLAEVDELLVKAGTTHELHLYVAGGAVIAAKTDSRLTGDVDVVSEGMTPQLRAAVEEVSQRHRGLRPDWLNDGAKLNGSAFRWSPSASSPGAASSWTPPGTAMCSP